MDIEEFDVGGGVDEAFDRVQDLAELAVTRRDDRNTDVEILLFEELAERRFGNWTMGLVNIAQINPALLLKYSEKPELNPFTCSGEAMLALLLEIAESGTIAQRHS